MSKQVLSESEYKKEFQSISNIKNESDKLRLIKVIGDSHHLTPKQAIDLVKQIISFKNLCDLCHYLQSSSTDEDTFIHMALDLCKYPEDRVTMCTALGVEFIP